MSFVDRVVEYPSRITLTDVDTGEVLGTFDVTRAEGTVTTAGTALTASNLNSELEAVRDEAVELAQDPFTISSNGNVSFQNLQSGSTSMTLAAKTVTKKWITFPTAFKTSPYVVVTPRTSAPHQVFCGAKDVSTTGFYIYAYRTSAGTTPFNWIAYKA